VLAVVGEKQEALSLQPEGRSLLRELGARRELALCAYATVRGRLVGGDAHSAELLQEVELLQEGLSLVRGMGAALETCLVLNTLAATFVNQGALGEAEPLYRESLQIAQEWGYPRPASSSLSGLGHVAYARGDYAEAKRRYEESLALRQQLGDSFWVGDSLKAIGDAELAMGDYQRARETYQASLARFDELAEPLGILDALCGLGDVAAATGGPLEARQYYRRAVETAVESGIVLAGLRSLVAVARWLAYKGEQARAAELTSLALAHGPFYTGWPGRPGVGQLLDELRTMLAPERFAAAEARGRELDLDQTLRELLAELKG
jgi:tetratricopeptide (TPR) repeat protein